MTSPARNRALRVVAGDGIDAEAVAAKARELAVMGWVRPTGEIHAEGEPDELGGANVEQVTEAFRILLEDKNTKAVLVNIFGGIMRCTTIASAILEAYKLVGFSVPLVVRLEGTNVKLGKKILADSGLPIISAKNMADAAQEVVAAAKAKK